MYNDNFADVIVFLVVCTAVPLAGAWFVSVLWNFLMPELFGLTTINFKQGLVMMILCNWLFGGFRSTMKGLKEKA